MQTCSRQLYSDMFGKSQIIPFFTHNRVNYGNKFSITYTPMNLLSFKMLVYERNKDYNLIYKNGNKKRWKNEYYKCIFKMIILVCNSKCKSHILSFVNVFFHFGMPVGVRVSSFVWVDKVLCFNFGTTVCEHSNYYLYW